MSDTSHFYLLLVLHFNLTKCECLPNQDFLFQILKLREKIQEVMGEEPYMGEEIPLRWLKFEESVKEAVKDDQNTMSVDEVSEI